MCRLNKCNLTTFADAQGMIQVPPWGTVKGRRQLPRWEHEPYFASEVNIIRIGRKQ